MGQKITFGQFFKKMRQKKSLSLPRFCTKNNIDPGNISNLERGSISPPNLGKSLNSTPLPWRLRREVTIGMNIFDLATAHMGKIPDDLMKNDELVKKLPLVFRTIRGQKVSKEKLDKLAEVIRKSFRGKDQEG